MGSTLTDTLHASFLAALRAEPGEPAHRHAFEDVLRDADLWTFPHLLGLMYADQDSDGLRLLAADWFAGEGREPQWGELIIRQVELHRLGYPDCEALRDPFDSCGARRKCRPCWLRHWEHVALRELEDCHPAWGFSWADIARVWRGFAYRVECPLAAFLEHGPALAAAHPLERVVLTDREPMHNSLGYWWQAGQYNARETDVLPTAWFGGGDACRNDSPEEAHAWASRRAVAWARGVAGGVDA